MLKSYESSLAFTHTPIFRFSLVDSLLTRAHRAPTAQSQHRLKNARTGLKPKHRVSFFYTCEILATKDFFFFSNKKKTTINTTRHAKQLNCIDRLANNRQFQVIRKQQPANRTRYASRALKDLLRARRRRRRSALRCDR